MAVDEKVHSKVMEYVFMGIAIGVGTLLVWTINSTDTNTDIGTAHTKDISNIQKDHSSEVERSKDVDAKQEKRADKHEAKLDKLLELIHKNDKAIGILQHKNQ